MNHSKNGLNNSDKILIVVALWICAIALFVATLTLPMLPEKVVIFAPPESEDAQYYSKYYNLILILMSLVPALIVIVSALIKERNRLKNNFLSISLFSIMLALCINGVIIYGILQQFDASKAVKLLNFHSLTVIIVSFVCSLAFALFPTILANKIGKGSRITDNLSKYWNIGAYGFLLSAIIGSFVPSAYCYIPLTAIFVAIVIFICCAKPKKHKDIPENISDRETQSE